MRSYRRCVALPLGDSRYLTVPTERFKMVMQVLTQMYKEGSESSESVAFPEGEAGLLGQLGLAFGHGWGRLAGERKRGQ